MISETDNTQRPLFSIITVCFNSEKTIERTLKSIASQSFKDYEYIVVDGASTDGTLNIIKEYQPMFGNKLRMISEPDHGIYDAMNKGLRMARGKVIGILNSDDCYEEDALLNVKEAYDRRDLSKPLQVFYGMVRVFEETGVFHSVIFLSHTHLKNQMIAHPGCFVTRESYEKIGLFSLQYRYAADYDLFLRFFKDSELVFIPVFKILNNFYLGGVSDNPASAEEGFKVRWKNGYSGRMTYYRQLIKHRLWWIRENKLHKK